MPDLSLTPASLNLTVYAGLPFTLDLEWPAGRLSGRTFVASVATIKGDVTFAPDLDIAGDVMSVDASGDDTASVYGRAARWVLYDTTDGPVGDDPGMTVMGGSFKATHSFGQPTSRTVEVLDRVADQTVTVVGAPGATGATGPAGDVIAPEYAGGDYAEGSLVHDGGLLWRANDDLVDQDPDTLDTANWDRVTGLVLKADITGTGLAASDVHAISTAGGAREDSVVDTGISGDYTPDLTRGNHFELHLTGNVNLLMPDEDQTPNDGLYSISVEVVYDGHTISSFDSRVAGPGGEPFDPDLGATSDLFGFYMNRDNTHWTALHVTQKSQSVGTFIELEASAQPAAPASGKVRLWVNSTDQHLKSIDGSSTVVDYTVGGVGAPDPGADPQISEVAGQEAYGQNASTSITATMPSDVTVDNLLVAVYWGDRYGTPTITPESGFQLAKRIDDGDATGFIAIYYKIATGPDDNSFTFSHSGGSGNAGYGSTPHGLWVQEYTGNETNQSLVLDRVGSYDSPDASTYQWDFATNNPSGSGVTTRANELAVVGDLFGIGYGDTPTWGSTGFANARVMQKATVGVKLLTATGVVDVHVTTGAHTNYFAGVVATFKAAAP